MLVPADRFHISKSNVREGQAFGESDEDKALIEQLRRGRIIEPFKARPEHNGYGVFVGRRRFLAKKEVGIKHFVVGQDCIVENISDDDAREASLIENLSILRQEMDPMTRARRVADIVDYNMAGLRAAARKLGISPSTLCEWTKILELSPRIQEAVAKGLICYTDALTLTRLKLGELMQEQLANILVKQGSDAFKRELEKVLKGTGRRGTPKGKYVVFRTTFLKASEADMYICEKLRQLADAKNMKVDEYCKQALADHVKNMY